MTSRSPGPSHGPDEERKGPRPGGENLRGTPSQGNNSRGNGTPSSSAREGTPPLGERQIPAWFPAFLMSLARLVWEILEDVKPWG